MPALGATVFSGVGLPQPAKQPVAPANNIAGSPGDTTSSVWFKGSTDEQGEVFAIEEFGSLQDQLMQTNSHMRNRNTINSVLKSSYSSAKTMPEAIVAATVDQNMASILGGQGKYGQAEQLYLNALKTMEKYENAPEYVILVESFAEFLDKRDRPGEAASYRSRITTIEIATDYGAIVI